MPPLRTLATIGIALLCVSLPAAAMGAGSSSVWRFRPGLAPEPPAGIPQAPYPVPLGEVGQISFWAPNRGLLITGGTQSAGGAVPAGLYAYDGVSWHELSSVCGGSKGRIAWAGPDEFWTISDQRAGQITGGHLNAGNLEALSLCHFVGGQVVGSYATPLGEANSYLEMGAAACLSADDCWFAGQDGPPPLGSFHLHWNGTEIEQIYDSSDHAVAGMAVFNGKLYEGLAIGAEDGYLSTEEPKHPGVLRTIAPAGQTPLCGGVPSSFCNVFLFSGQQLPTYAEKSLPDALGGFDVATDGGPLGAGATQMWAGASPVNDTPAGSAQAGLTLLHNEKGVWTQMLPLLDGGILLPAGAKLNGSSSDVNGNRTGEPGFDSIAPEPGTKAAWLSLLTSSGESAATVALIEAKQPQSPGEASAVVNEIDELPGPQDSVGFRGLAGPIDCPSADDCWMATRRSGHASGGWLFHLTDDAQPTPDEDPLFDGADGVIDYRPPDDGVPVVYPDEPPTDDSLANQQQPSVLGRPEPMSQSDVKPKKPKPLVTHLKSVFSHHRVLIVSFVLTARAHVRLIGRRDRRVVAQTPRESLRPGSHRLSLRLDPARWPTGLRFEAKPLGSSAPGLESGTSETIGT